MSQCQRGNNNREKQLTCSCSMWSPLSGSIFFPPFSPTVFPLSSLCPRIQPTNGCHTVRLFTSAHLCCVHSWVAERNTTGSFLPPLCVFVFAGKKGRDRYQPAAKLPLLSQPAPETDSMTDNSPAFSNPQSLCLSLSLAHISVPASLSHHLLLLLLPSLQ